MGHFYQERQCSVLIRVWKKKQGGNKAKKGWGWWGKVLPSWGTDVQIEIQQRSKSRGRKRDRTWNKEQDEKTTTLIRVYCPLSPPVLYLFLCFSPAMLQEMRIGQNQLLSHERNVSFLPLSPLATTFVSSTVRGCHFLRFFNLFHPLPSDGRGTTPHFK